jgi:hypothetical protein
MKKHPIVREAGAKCSLCDFSATSRVTAMQEGVWHTEATGHPVVVREERFTFLGVWPQHHTAAEKLTLARSVELLPREESKR